MPELPGPDSLVSLLAMGPVAATEKNQFLLCILESGYPSTSHTHKPEWPSGKQLHSSAWGICDNTRPQEGEKSSGHGTN